LKWKGKEHNPCKKIAEAPASAIRFLELDVSPQVAINPYFCHSEAFPLVNGNPHLCREENSMLIALLIPCFEQRLERNGCANPFAACRWDRES
jgi:hypothetical protein